MFIKRLRATPIIFLTKTMAAPTREQLISNIQALKKQGAPQADIQSYLDSFKGQRPTTPLAAPAAAPEAPKRSLIGRAAEFLAPTATKTVEKFAKGEDIGVRDVLGSALEVGSFLIPVGFGVKGATLAAKGAVLAGRAFGKRAAQKVAGGLAAKAISYGAGGAAAGGLAEAGRAIGEGGGVGEVAERTAKGASVGGAVGAAIPVVGKVFGRKAVSKEAVAGRVFQPLQQQEFIEKTGAKILSKVDTKGIGTYDDLSRVLESNIDKNLSRVDVAFEKVKAPVARKNLRRIVTAKLEDGVEVKAKINYVNKALRDLRELYSTTRDVAEKARIELLVNKAKNGQLVPGDVNKIAREYGTKFGQKAFNKMGEPLTSVNAVTFENTRIGLKETARSFLPDDATRMLDKEITDMILLKKLSDNMKTKVTALENRIKERGLVEKIFRGVANVAEIATFGGPRAFVTKFLFPSNVGLKTMNSLDLQRELVKNLNLIRQLEKSSDNKVVKTLRGLARRAGVVSAATNFGGRKEKQE